MRSILYTVSSIVLGSVGGITTIILLLSAFIAIFCYIRRKWYPNFTSETRTTTEETCSAVSQLQARLLSYIKVVTSTSYPQQPDQTVAMMELHNRLAVESESPTEAKETSQESEGDHSPGGEVRKRHKQGSHSPDDSPQK